MMTWTTADNCEAMLDAAKGFEYNISEVRIAASFMYMRHIGGV